MAIRVEFLLLKFGRFQRDILLLRFFLVKYAFWGFVGLSEQGGDGFFVGFFKVKVVGGWPDSQKPIYTYLIVISYSEFLFHWFKF